jgi:hypothetical protein
MTIHPLASLTKLVKPAQIVFGTDFPFLKRDEFSLNRFGIPKSGDF